MDRLTIERHLKQNKEIIRINQVQSNRIVTLEAEVSKLLSENIQLRTQVIQLNHKQDLSTQKAQIERKLRELQRMVRSFGDSSTTSGSPGQIGLRKSPKKADLLNFSAEQSPGPARLDFISVRSRPRSLAAPVRVARSQPITPLEPGLGREETTPTEADDIEPVLQQRAESCYREERREEREREKVREARRSSRRMSRTSDEIVPLPQSEVESGEDSIARLSSQESGPQLISTERISTRRSRSSMSFERPPLKSMKAESATSPSRTRLLQADNDDKENAPSERRSTAAIRLLHSSPVKSRSALNVLADPLPSLNIQVCKQTPSKPLHELSEVKSEPTSPALDPVPTLQASNQLEQPEESTGRSRRGKTVNYAEPSLRHKMRRTESLPGDKRRKSSYRRTSSSIMDEARRSSAAHQTITIEED